MPTASSVACITLPGTYTVTTFRTGVVAQSLGLGGASGTQTLTVLGTCAQGPAALVLSTAALIGRHGALRLDSTGCAAGALQMNGGTLVNTGVITMSHAQTNGQWPRVEGTLLNGGRVAIGTNVLVLGAWTNTGTITLADQVFAQVQGSLVNNGVISATGSGQLSLLMSTFTYGSGTTSGTHPVEMVDGRVIDNGTGKGTIWVHGGTTTLTGNIAAGQSLVLSANCVDHFATLFVPASWTNRGTVWLESDGACLEHAIIEDKATFTNDGSELVAPLSATNSNSVIEGGTFDNGKTVGVAAGTSLVSEGASYVNGASASLTLGIESGTRYGVLAFDADPAVDYTLGGTLNVSTAAGYWPATGLTFPILSGSSTGTFANVTGLTRAGQSVAYHVGYTASAVNLTTS